MMDSAVERFITENLSDVEPEPRLVLSFQVTESVQACWKFVYYVINNAVLTDDELTHYKDTWLAKHNLTLHYKKASSSTTSGHQQPAATAISNYPATARMRRMLKIKLTATSNYRTKLCTQVEFSNHGTRIHNST